MQKQKYTNKPNRLIYFAQETPPFNEQEMKDIQGGSGELQTIDGAKKFLKRNIQEVEELVKKEYGKIVTVYDEQGGTSDYELPKDIQQNLELEVKLLQEAINEEFKKEEMTQEKLSLVRHIAYEISSLIGFKIEIQKINQNQQEISTDQFHTYITKDADKDREVKKDLKNPEYPETIQSIFKIIDSEIDWPGVFSDNEYSKEETALKSAILNLFYLMDRGPMILEKHSQEYEELINQYLKENKDDMTQKKVDELIIKINQKYEEDLTAEKELLSGFKEYFQESQSALSQIKTIENLPKDLVPQNETDKFFKKDFKNITLEQVGNIENEIKNLKQIFVKNINAEITKLKKDKDKHPQNLKKQIENLQDLVEINTDFSTIYNKIAEITEIHNLISKPALQEASSAQTSSASAETSTQAVPTEPSPSSIETTSRADVISQNWATKKDVAFANLKDRKGNSLQKGAKYRLATNMSDFHIRTDTGETQKVTLPKGGECEIIEDQKAYSVLNKYNRNYDYVKIKYTVDGKDTVGWTANGYFEKVKDAAVESQQTPGPIQVPEAPKPPENQPESTELKDDIQRLHTASEYIKSKSLESEIVGENLVIHLAPQLNSELGKYIDSFLPEMREGLKAKVVTPILKEYELAIPKNEITSKNKADDIKKYLDDTISKKEIKQEEINQKLETARTELNTFAWKEIFSSENPDLFQKYRDKYLGVDTIGSFEVQDNQVTFEVDLYGEAKNAKITVNNPKNVKGGYFEGKFEKNSSIYPISGCRTIESMFAEIERSRLRYQYEHEPIAKIAGKESSTSTIELDEENLKEIKENMRKKFNLGKKVWENLLNEWTIQDLEKFKEKYVKMDKTQKRGDLIDEINEVYKELGKTPINELRGFFDNADYTIVGLKEFSFYMIWNKKHLKTQPNSNENLDSILTAILKMNTGH